MSVEEDIFLGSLITTHFRGMARRNLNLLLSLSFSSFERKVSSIIITEYGRGLQLFIGSRSSLRALMRKGMHRTFIFSCNKIILGETRIVGFQFESIVRYCADFKLTLISPMPSRSWDRWTTNSHCWLS